MIGKKTKIIWPTPEELEKMLWTESTLKISKKLGVSDKAIEKFAKRHNLSKPPRGYWTKKNAKVTGLEPE